MDLLSVSHQKKRVTISLLAGGLLFIMAPILTAWLSPYNVKAENDGSSAPAKTVQAAADTENLRPLAEAGEAVAADLKINGRAVAARTIRTLAAAAVPPGQSNDNNGSGGNNDNANGNNADPADAGTGAAPSPDPSGGTSGNAVVDIDPAAGAAVTGFWSLAWSKAWPPIRSIVMTLWGMTKSVFLGIWNLVKDVGDVNADINAAVNMPLNAAPVNAAP